MFFRAICGSGNEDDEEEEEEDDAEGPGFVDLLAVAAAEAQKEKQRIEAESAKRKADQPLRKSAPRPKKAATTKDKPATPVITIPGTPTAESSSASPAQVANIPQGYMLVPQNSMLPPAANQTVALKDDLLTEQLLWFRNEREGKKKDPLEDDDEERDLQPDLINETIEVYDDSAENVMMSLRHRLRNPNAPPADWWPKHGTRMSKPVRGSSLILDHVMGEARIHPTGILDRNKIY